MEIDTLLAVTLDNDALSLYIASVWMTKQGIESSSSTRLTLHNCHDAPKVVPLLHSAIGQQCTYEVIEQSATTTTSVWIDYSADDIVLTCESIEELTADILPEDWKRLCQRIASLYMDMEQRYLTISQRYAKLKGKVEQELDRCHKKLALLQNSHPEKATAVAAQAKAYQQILTRVAQIEEAERQTEPKAQS
jgi:hypothetical protein